MQKQEEKPKTIDEVYPTLRDKREKYVREELLPELPSGTPTMELYWLVWGDIKFALKGVREIISDRIKELKEKSKQCKEYAIKPKHGHHPVGCKKCLNRDIRIYELERLLGPDDLEEGS